MTATLAAIAVGIVLVVGALRAVISRNVVHAVLWLGFVLVATAVLYVMLDAPLLAGLQVLLYVGGVMTLMIFGVMLTRSDDELTVASESGARMRGAMIALSLFAVLASSITSTDFGSPSSARAPSIAAIGGAVLGDELLAFEVLSLVLLAAMVGAIVLARRHDPSRSETSMMHTAATREASS